jgi:hypothetical protein
VASFSVISNVAASNAQANLYSTNIGLRNALMRVSSGFRPNDLTRFSILNQSRIAALARQA